MASVVPCSPSSSAPECPVCQLPTAGSVQPHSQLHPCPFCGKAFGRVDGARRHAKSCPQKGNRPLPPEAKRGRKLRACDQCSRVKVLCDANAPCGRCVSRHQECTYRWLCNDASHRREPPNAREAGRVPLAFLVNFTDPKKDFVTEQAIAGEPESNVNGPGARKPCTVAHDTLEFIDPMLLFSSLLDPCLDASPDGDGTYNDNGQDPLGPFSLEPPNDRLAARVNLLAAELEDFAASKPKFRDTFDWAAFTDLFSSANVHQFATAYSRKRHYQFPIIHWPTFDLEEAALPLLLAVALSGAAYSHHPADQLDLAFRSRDFYCIADAYIFKHLRACVETFTPTSKSKGNIELYQAGLLGFVLDCYTSSDEMHRIAFTKRLPTLVAAMRRFQLTGIRHEASEDWAIFIERESHIRLVAWTFFADSTTTLFCNTPPRMALSEMCGHMPCNAEVWDTESAGDFQERWARENGDGGPECLQDLVRDLLAEEWPGVDSKLCGRLHFRHWHAIICAFQPIIFNLHTSMLPTHGTSVLLRALDRWEAAWDSALRRLPADQRRWMGVARNSAEVAWLSRKIIEVNGTSAAESLAYLQRVPGHDAEDLHDLIMELRTNPALGGQV